MTRLKTKQYETLPIIPFNNANTFRTNDSHVICFVGTYISQCFSPFGVHYHWAALSAIFVQGISSEARVVSMAFLKNYAFFVLILFPCSFHVVNALNYAMFEAGNGNFMLRWSYSNNKLVFNMTCKVTGWCAVGFTTTSDGRGMVRYDIAAGGVDNVGQPYLDVSSPDYPLTISAEITDYQSSGHSRP